MKRTSSFHTHKEALSFVRSRDYKGLATGSITYSRNHMFEVQYEDGKPVAPAVRFFASEHGIITPGDER